MFGEVPLCAHTPLSEHSSSSAVFWSSPRGGGDLKLSNSILAAVPLQRSRPRSNPPLSPRLPYHQLPGLEECLLELLEERARHLTAMESLTGQLRRREAEATKASHDIKGLTARLECVDQDKSALERRARAAGEEQRVERARWFVHKQVCIGSTIAFAKKLKHGFGRGVWVLGLGLG